MSERLIKGIGMTSQRTRDRLVQRLKDKGIEHTRVLEVIRHTPRHLFVDEALQSRSYEDTALPIGHRQTISQPFVVARMTEALLEGVEPETVLEVGTGSGYQTAILGQMVPRVFTVERVAELSQLARERIRKLRLFNIHFKISDGSWGWPENGPYDAIMVTAAPEEIPEALLHQLAEGGRMVIPIGGERQTQKLVLITRRPDCYEQVSLGPVSFVPLVSGQGRV